MEDSGVTSAWEWGSAGGQEHVSCVEAQGPGHRAEAGETGAWKPGSRRTVCLITVAHPHNPG